MITISQETWFDLQNEKINPIASVEIKKLLNNAVNAGFDVWLTDEEGLRLKRFRVADDELICLE